MAEIKVDYVLLLRFHRGEVLLTAATGELSDAVADNAGLVSTHAYAVLDVRWVNQSINQSVHILDSQSINQSNVSQSINQSIDLSFIQATYYPV